MINFNAGTMRALIIVSGPFGLSALFTAIILIIVNVTMLIRSCSRKVAIALLILAFIPFLIGIFGYLFGLHLIEQVILAKEQAGIKISPNEFNFKYFEIRFPMWEGVISSIVTLLFAIFVFIFRTRPKVKALFSPPKPDKANE
jgi:hypothetical protein